MKKTPETLEDVAPEASRRRLVKAFGSAVVAAPVMSMLGCGTPPGQSSSTSSASESSSAPASSSSVSSVSSASSSSQSAGDAIIQGPISVSDLASDGTQSIQVTFPPANPFENGMPTTNSCSQPTGTQILGPCHLEFGQLREDISDGELGVPVIYAFKCVNTNCEPLPGVIVHAWHTNCDGQYSADESQGTPVGTWLGSICSGETPLGTESYTPQQVAHAKSSIFHRGANVTDNEGVVYFKSCFPGWYSTRTNHIHFRFVVNNQDVLITQTGFPDEVCDEIHLNHPQYRGKLQDRTMLPISGRQQDGTFSGEPKEQWIMDVARYADGTLLVTKTFILPV